MSIFLVCVHKHKTSITVMVNVTIGPLWRYSKTNMDIRTQVKNSVLFTN